jgi:hypothetical protein
MLPPMEYTRRDLAQAVLDANPAGTGPMSGFDEAGLLIRRLEGTGVLDKVDEIHALNEMSKKAHLDIVEELLGIVDSTIESVTTEDVIALGVNVTLPKTDDYEMDC